MSRVKSIKARIQCTVDIYVDAWDGRGPTDLDALSEQVRKEGVRKLEKLVKEADGRVYGEPKVTLFMIEEN